MERSIALAYEAVEHYPNRKLHITNELIHNPEVNDRLTEMNVNLIEKLGEGKKDFSTINDGDVVILPAFGASYEEMEMLDKKVRAMAIDNEKCYISFGMWYTHFSFSLWNCLHFRTWKLSILLVLG